MTNDASARTAESVSYTSGLDRAVTFLYEVAGDNNGLASRLADCERTPVAWVQIASTAGYDFTEDDLREVSEELLQRPVGRESCVQELVADLLPVADGQIKLPPEALDRLKAVMQQGRFSGYYRPW